MFKQTLVFIIIIGILFLVLSIKQFLDIYKLHILKKVSNSQLLCASLAILGSLIFEGGAVIIWLIIVYGG